MLHVDLKELVLSIGGYRYVVFAVDEYSRFVFIDFLKKKSEVANAAKRIIAAFDATVATPVDDAGRPLPRPRVREVHSDREGGLISHYFLDFCAAASVHPTTSPPHDHDLNPIAERTIGLISETASAIKEATDAPVRLWPWLITYAVDWHNATISSAGSSSADVNITPHQRLTHRPPRVMDLAAFGSRAVVLKPPTHQHKPSLSARGWVGAFLGRSRYAKGGYDVLVGQKVVCSSSVLVDEEHFDWAPPTKRHQPLTAVSHAAAQPQWQALRPGLEPAGAVASAPSTYDDHRALRFLNLFSGPYSRADGLAPHLRARGWAEVDQVDNDGEKGGGWEHDLLNDASFAALLSKAAAGRWHAMHIAFPCSTGSVSRFFDASSDGSDRGPPPVRDHDHPDGLPEDQVDPKHVRELRNANLLLQRVVRLACAARASPAKTVISFENPADRSDESSVAYSPELKMHGSIFATTAFKQLRAMCGFERSTFAYCRLDAPHQKYTSLYYTPELTPVLGELNSPDYQCNHPRGTHSARVGGRDSDGTFGSSKQAAAYPAKLNEIIARAFTRGCTGGDRAPAAAASAPKPLPPPSPSSPAADRWQGLPTPPVTGASAAGGVSSHAGEPARADGGVPPSAALAPPSQLAAEPSKKRPAPIAFPSLTPAHAPPTIQPAPPAPLPMTFPRVEPPPAAGPRPHPRAVRAGTREANHGPISAPLPPVAEASPPPSPHTPAAKRHAVDSSDDYTPQGTAREAYLPFDAAAVEVMEAAVAQTLLSTAADAPAPASASNNLIPITAWSAMDGSRAPKRSPRSWRATRLPNGRHALPVLVALDADETLSLERADALCLALRADSPGAPSNHREAMESGAIWIDAEGTEIGNHKRNQSWKTIKRDEVPAGRRIHKLIWVYKLKRDGTAKARLCVQGNTLQSGVDFDQTWSSALRYSSARALFAYAARKGCRVRSVDLVAAYLQGRFVDGEVVYCHLPTGHPELDESGQPMIARVDKPIYGIQQAGRRLQRMLFAWLREHGFTPLDDSDPCIFSKSCPNGEILTIGVYVDNLQIVHSAQLDAEGRGPAGCAYNSFMDALTADWDVTDEGPMEDLLGIEVDYLPDGAIKLHQTSYVRKLVERFLPDGPVAKVQYNSLPYSPDFMQHVADALALPPNSYPELVRPMQERLGCLLYAATSTRCDIAFVVHYLCKCMQRPTPELIRETDYIFSYLARLPSAGLTYTREQMRLTGYADASWETASSTSGWVVLWQSAALSWGSRKQKSIALSTCEAEIIALSEAAKDMVYLRKLTRGLGEPEPGPSPLSTDSQSARDVSYNPEHHDRMKHVQRRHFFVRDMVETFELEVPFVRTTDNIADFFTKPMKSATQFHTMRKIIMNEPA